MPTDEEIKELCALGEKAWFGLLGFLAFFAVVILSTTDSDFLVGTKQTQIPLIGVSVPTERFFFVAPIVGTILYVYMHLYCIRLWQAMRTIDVDKERRPTSLIGDVAFHLKPGINARGGAWSRLGVYAAGFLLWVAHPALLVAGIARSQAASRSSWLDPATYPHLSRLVPTTVEGMMIVCLALSLAIGTVSYMTARAIGTPSNEPTRWRRFMPAAAIVAALLPVAVGDGIGRIRMTPVTLDRQNLAGVAPNWPLASERRDDFRETWCKEQGVPKKICGNLPARARYDTDAIKERREDWCNSEPGSNRIALFQGTCTGFFEQLEDDFRAEWNDKRRAELGRIPELDLSERQLSRATAEGTKFINVRMEKAVLRDAYLKSADFEGADLLGAQLGGAYGQYAIFDRANLTGAQLPNANLASASFEGADLLKANLRGANLVDAHLVGADLRGADLTAANLTNARLTHARIDGTILAGAILSGADLSGARGLKDHQFSSAIADGKTDFTFMSEDPEGINVMVVQSCWKDAPEAVREVIATLPASAYGDVRREDLEKRICGRTEEVEMFPGPRQASTAGADSTTDANDSETASAVQSTPR